MWYILKYTWKCHERKNIDPQDKAVKFHNTLLLIYMCNVKFLILISSTKKILYKIFFQKIYRCHIAKQLHNSWAYRKENITRHRIQHFKKQIHGIKTLGFRPPMQCLIFLLTPTQRSMLDHSGVKLPPKELDLLIHMKLWRGRRILSNIQNLPPLLRWCRGVQPLRTWQNSPTPLLYYHTIEWNGP